MPTTDHADGALLTWTCEGCGVRRKVAVPMATQLKPQPAIPIPGWGLISDTARGALAFCGTCWPKTCRRMALPDAARKEGVA